MYIMKIRECYFVVSVSCSRRCEFLSLVLSDNRRSVGTSTKSFWQYGKRVERGIVVVKGLILPDFKP